MRWKPLELRCNQWRSTVWRVCLLVQPNPQAFLRMGDCQSVRNPFLKKSRLQTSNWSYTRTHTYTSLIYPFHSTRSSTQPGTPKHTRSLIQSSVPVWYGAQTVMTVSASCVIEVMEAQTGWRLSSDVSDRELTHRFIYLFSSRGEMRWQQSSLRAFYPSIGLCVYLTFSSWRSFVSSLCPLVCFNLSVFLSCLPNSFSLSFFFYYPKWYVDEFHPFIPVAVTASRKTM